MTWQLLAIVAAALWATVNILDKYTISKFVKNPLVMFSSTGLVTAILAVVIYFLGLVKPVPFYIAFLTMLAGGLNILAGILYFKAIKKDDISRVAPLFHVAPLFTAVGAAIFLGEIFSGWTYFGVAVIVLGVILISPKDEDSYLWVSSAFWQMMLAALLVSLGNVAAKHALDMGGYWTSLFYLFLGEVIVIIPIFWKAYDDIVKTVRQHGKRVLGPLLMIESFDVIAMLIYYAAITTGFVTLVNSLASVQPFFVLLYATILSILFPKMLKEEKGNKVLAQKFIAITLIFIGLLLVA